MYRKEGTRVPFSKYKGFGVYSMNKTWDRRKMFITRENVATRLSSCSAPSQPLLMPLLWGEIAL